MPRTLLITLSDLKWLRAMLRSRSDASLLDQEHLHDLTEELERAVVIDDDSTPHDLVTINSIVGVEDLLTGKCHAYTLVFPAEADIASGRISVLAPLGTALLGYREGDELRWKMPGGTRHLRVRSVIRPEQSPPPDGAPPRPWLPDGPLAA